jgi:hypothetical protein
VSLLVLDRQHFESLLGPLLPQLEAAAKNYSGYRPNKLGVQVCVCGSPVQLLVPPLQDHQAATKLANLVPTVWNCRFHALFFNCMNGLLLRWLLWLWLSR